MIKEKLAQTCRERHWWCQNEGCICWTVLCSIRLQVMNTTVFYNETSYEKWGIPILPREAKQDEVWQRIVRFWEILFLVPACIQGSYLGNRANFCRMTIFQLAHLGMGRISLVSVIHCNVFWLAPGVSLLLQSAYILTRNFQLLTL